MAGMDLLDSPRARTRRTVMRLAVACTRLVLLVTLHLALCSLLWFCRPTMLGIMTGMARRTALRFVLAVTCTRLVLLVECISRCVRWDVG